MTIDNVIVSKQVNISAEKGTLDLRVQATDVRAEDAIRANALFDRFVGEMSGQRPITKHQIIVPWTDPEKTVVLAAKSVDDAWEDYHAAFPDSKREKKTVRRWWMNNQSLGKIDVSPKKIEAPRVKSQRCTTERKVAKKKTEIPAADGKRKGTHGFPSSESRFLIPSWSEDEKKIVSDCSTKEAAWDAYQKAFPRKRNQNAVFQRYYKLKKASTIKGEKKTVIVQKDPKSDPVGGTRPKEVKVKDLKIIEEPVEPKKGGPAPADTPSGQSGDNVITRYEGDGKDSDSKPVKLVRGMQVHYIGTHPHVAFQGLKEIKRVNELSGEALIDIGKGIEWIPTRDLAVAS